MAVSGLATRAPAPVYACIGPGLLPAAERLLQHPGIMPAASPRHAAILLVAGGVPQRSAAGFERLHDQLPHPRATFEWDGSEDGPERIGALWRDLLDGRASEPDRRPDEPPNEWRGKGDHGQGGEGMMGGVPYGRPMAMTGEDIRDGLALDRYTARLGPFAPFWPPGLEIEITFQGDVIVAAEVCEPPYAQPPGASEPAACAARMLRLLGLDLAACRVASGRRPLAFGIRAAVPPSLARHEGEDARGRLSGWLRGEPGPAAAPDPASLLPGLEWHEAMLALASFSPAALFRTLGGTP